MMWVRRCEAGFDGFEKQGKKETDLSSNLNFNAMHGACYCLLVVCGS